MIKLQWILFAIIVWAIAATVFIGSRVHSTLTAPSPVPQYTPIPKPDFTTFTDVQQKKQAFFDYLLPSVRQANDQILSQREQVLQLSEKLKSGELSARDRQIFDQLSEQYEIDPELSDQEKFELLNLRVDIVPASLALAQAAKESGWGTSRFSVDGNNYFGQWCFSRGCGLVPNRRLPGATHEVRYFETTEESVASYIHNLNTHPPYRPLRELRAEMRDEGKLTGIELAQGLTRYSERGPVYIGEIQSIIRVNDLTPLDRPVENQE